MRIGIIGFGYVGSAVADGFRKSGHVIYVYDIAAAAIKRARGEKYFVCAGLPELVTNSEVIFICVPTPSMPDGRNDSTIVKKTVETIARLCEKETILVIKSTIMVGTTDKLIKMVRVRNKSLQVLVNPEFLTARNAHNDFLNPDRIVIGGRNAESMNKLKGLYKKFSKNILLVDPSTAELAKYASNSFLAAKVSFANQIKLICLRVDANPAEVMKIVGLDRRIGPSHLNPNMGPFSGGCLPKDLDALIFETSKEGVDNCLICAVRKINEDIKKS